MKKMIVLEYHYLANGRMGVLIKVILKYIAIFNCFLQRYFIYFSLLLVMTPMFLMGFPTIFTSKGIWPILETDSLTYICRSLQIFGGKDIYLTNVAPNASDFIGYNPEKGFFVEHLKCIDFIRETFPPGSPIYSRFTLPSIIHLSEVIFKSKCVAILGVFLYAVISFLTMRLIVNLGTIKKWNYNSFLFIAICIAPSYYYRLFLIQTEIVTLVCILIFLYILTFCKNQKTKILDLLFATILVAINFNRQSLFVSVGLVILYELAYKETVNCKRNRIFNWNIFVILLQVAPGYLGHIFDQQILQVEKPVRMSSILAKLLTTSPVKIIDSTYVVDFQSMMTNFTVFDLLTPVAILAPLVLTAILAFQRNWFSVPMSLFCVQSLTDTYFNGLTNYPRMGGTFFRYNLVSSIGFFAIIYIMRKSFEKSDVNNPNTSLQRKQHNS